MKLFHTIIQFDVYVLAESPETARETAVAAITAGELPPSEQVALEPRRPVDLVAAWRDQPPFVAADVINYEPVVEDTVAVLFERLYVQPQAKAGGKKRSDAAVMP